MSSVLVAGSVAIDNIITPTEEHYDLLGGSATYAAFAASFTAPVSICAAVGSDFPKVHRELFDERGIDLTDLHIDKNAKTFRWTGEYKDDMNERETLDTEINVLESYKPKVTGEGKKSTIIALANMPPADQMAVLEQASSPNYVIGDTMDLWIEQQPDTLKDLFKKLDMLVINDSEAKMFMKARNLMTAGARLRELGPETVIIKKGEHGALIFGDDKFFSTSAFPLKKVVDPTGAGDTFLGGLAGHLAVSGKDKFNFEDLRDAVIYGTILAGFNCESFSADRLLEITTLDVAERTNKLREFTNF